MLKTVDLPQPDGPIIDTNSPRRTENDMPSTAVTAPSVVLNRIDTLSMTSSTSLRLVAMCFESASKHVPFLLRFAVRHEIQPQTSGQRLELSPFLLGASLQPKIGSRKSPVQDYPLWPLKHNTMGDC